ncbi:MAG TPA: threonine/serine exporter family protein [Pirellulales bacterium]|nr:threonine/serine exporter family protein [Pirellulales bacterium]
MSTKPSAPRPETPPPNAKIDLLLALARALHTVGLPAHRLEAQLLRSASRLDVSLQIMSMPPGQLLSFDGQAAPLTYLLRTQAGRVDLWAWTQLHKLCRQLDRGNIEVAAARRRLDEIEQPQGGWGRLPTVAAYVLSGGAFAIFFGAGTIELWAALAVGLAVGCVAVALRRVRASSRLFELAAALAAGLIVGSVDVPLGAFAEWVPLAAGLIILLPGIMLVDATEELAQGYLVAGSARMAGVGVVFLAMTIGVMMGWHLAELIPGSAMTKEPKPLAEWTWIPALAVVALGSTIRFGARLADYGWILLGSAVALSATRFGTNTLGPVCGEFFGAFVLGLTARLAARWRDITAELVIIPGLALLVPGSLGVKTFSSLLDQDPYVAVQSGFQMFLVAMALVAGLLFSDSLAGEKTAA